MLAEFWFNAWWYGCALVSAGAVYCAGMVVGEYLFELYARRQKNIFRRNVAKGAMDRLNSIRDTD